jgi:hypothetical protein
MDGVTPTFGQKPFATKARRAPFGEPFTGSPTAWRNGALDYSAPSKTGSIMYSSDSPKAIEPAGPHLADSWPSAFCLNRTAQVHFYRPLFGILLS